MKITMKIIMRGDYAGCSVSLSVAKVIRSQEQKKSRYKLWEHPGKTTDYVEKRPLSKYSVM